MDTVNFLCYHGFIEKVQQTDNTKISNSVCCITSKKPKTQLFDGYDLVFSRCVLKLIRKGHTKTSIIPTSTNGCFHIYHLLNQSLQGTANGRHNFINLMFPLTKPEQLAYGHVRHPYHYFISGIYKPSSAVIPQSSSYVRDVIGY